MIVKLLTEHHLRFLSLNGGCTGSSESTLVKKSNCWKYHATAQFILTVNKPTLLKKRLMQYFVNIHPKIRAFHMVLIKSN